MPLVCRLLSERILVGLARSNAQRVVKRHYENLAVTDLAGFGRGLDCGHNAIGLIVVDRYFNADLGEETDYIFRPSIELRMTFLAAVAFHLRQGHTVDALTRNRVEDVIDFERLNDCYDELHVTPSRVPIA